MLTEVVMYALVVVSVMDLVDMRQISRDCYQECNEYAPPMGDMSCPDGYVCYHSGCSATCVHEVKRSPNCEVLICDTWCDNGRVMDQNGCPTCTCL